MATTTKPPRTRRAPNPEPLQFVTTIKSTLIDDTKRTLIRSQVMRNFYAQKRAAQKLSGALPASHAGPAAKGQKHRFRLPARFWA
jgi:hypothetical protein